MSSSDINLVSSKTYQLQEELKRLKTLKIIAIGSLSLVALVSVLLFIITITLPVASVKKNQEQTLSNISSLHEKLVKYSLIDDRLNNISGVIKTRKNYAKLAGLILNKLPVDLSVDSMTIDGGTFNIVISGGSLTPINTFIEEIVVIGNRDNIIKNLIVQGLVANIDTGKYTLTLQADTL